MNDDVGPKKNRITAAALPAHFYNTPLGKIAKTEELLNDEADILSIIK